MSMGKGNEDGIDQDFLLESLVQHTKATIPQEEGKTKVPSKKKKINADYCTNFLQRNEIKTRQCVYISREIHNKISKIVNIVADQGITVGGYVDNVLAMHLAENKEEINNLYCQDRDELI